MKDILFYLLLGVLFYYILSRFLEYYTLEQENFDPSLVPVSSIVTLAKVAQKLVTGGVLTNPGSLQIGTTNAGGAGNLVVTGNSTVNGNTTLANVKINPVGTTGNTIIQYGDGTGKKIVFQKDDANPQLEIFDNKKVNIKGNLNVDGILSGNTTVVGTNPTNFGQTTIDGGKITVGDTNNSVEKLVMPTGTAIRIIGKDGGALSTSTTNPLLWDNTGVTSNNLKVLGTLITPSISATPASTNINAPIVSVTSPSIRIGDNNSTTTINGNLTVNGLVNGVNLFRKNLVNLAKSGSFFYTGWTPPLTNAVYILFGCRTNNSNTPDEGYSLSQMIVAKNTNWIIKIYNLSNSWDGNCRFKVKNTGTTSKVLDEIILDEDSTFNYDISIQQVA